VRAVGLVRKHGDLPTALAAIGKEMPEMEQVRQLFLAHPVDAGYRPTWRAPDTKKAGDILEAAGLGRARIEELARAIAPAPQKGLADF
jgi:hypothetical protein